MTTSYLHFKPWFFLFTLLTFFLASCETENPVNSNNQNFDNNTAIFLLIDEESIDNGNEPNNFSETDVNDHIADIGLRMPLKYFRDNVGKTIDLYTGQVGDEGWFAPKTILASWINAGPTNNGSRNYFKPGPGLGASVPDDDREVLLDKIPDITPLRASGLTMLKGKTIYAVVYDSDISVNYSPLLGNLQGANLGVVAFDVINVVTRTGGSSSSLPRVTIRLRSVDEVALLNLSLFSNAPVPQSSSEPFDITVPSSVPAIILVDAK